MSREILAHFSSCDPVMAALARTVGPYAPETDECHPFEALAQAIAHQQLNGIAARTILRRLVEACGEGCFPSPQWILDTPVERLRAAGFSGAKVAALKDLAAQTLTAVVPERAALLDLDDEAIIERLTQVRGVGRWTVEMLLIFRLGRPDVLPVDDFGVRAGFRAAYGLKALPHPKALAAWGERWKPHRSAAAWYLWRALELKRAGTLPEPAERIRLPRVKRRRRKAAVARKRRLVKRTAKRTAAKRRQPRRAASRVRKTRARAARK
jgi:DNA-3-methyladenine glycosylase II